MSRVKISFKNSSTYIFVCKSVRRGRERREGFHPWNLFQERCSFLEGIFSKGDQEVTEEIEYSQCSSVDS